jgi:3-hydroxybutyryl-CoA dehydrogenase
MSNVLVVGDGPLAYEMAAWIEAGGHTVYPVFFNESGRGTDLFESASDALDALSPRLDWLVEAVIGDPRYKREIVEEIVSQLDHPLLTCVLNASAAEVGSWTLTPGRVVGWAALPPLSSAGVIELLPGLNTTPDTLAAARQFLAGLGKEPVLVKDTVGGVLPRMVANLINEAAYALGEGIAAPEDIDQAMKLGMNYPYGPLEWADLIGLDQVAALLDALGRTYGADTYRPAPLLQQLVFAGHWGRRSGRGFYTYATSDGSAA